MSSEEKVKARLCLLPLSELMLWESYIKNQAKVLLIKAEIDRRERNIFEGEAKYQYRASERWLDEKTGWKECSLEEYEKCKDLARFETRIIYE